MPSIQLSPYTIAAADHPALWRVKTLVDGREIGREVLSTADAQRRLDAVRAERARMLGEVSL